MRCSQANAAQSWVSAEQREVALEKLLEALPALISWPRERVRTAAPTLHEDLSTSKDLDRIQLRSVYKFLAHSWQRYPGNSQYFAPMQTTMFKHAGGRADKRMLPVAASGRS